MENLVNTNLCERLADQLNRDDAFRHWARALTTGISISVKGENCCISIREGEVFPEMICETEVFLTGSEREWENALHTPYNQGFYDVTEGAGMLHLTARPLLIASNAKAFTRFWKQLRSVLCNEEREWDWNV